MTVAYLPKDLGLDTLLPIQVFDYRTFDSILRTKVNLNKNTISFLIEGEKEVFTDGESINIGNDHFLLMKSGNCLMTETTSPINNTYRSLLLFFTDEMVLAFLEKHQLHFETQHDSKAIYVFEYDDYIKHYVEGLQQIYQLEKGLQKQLLGAKFEELMIYLVQKQGKAFLQALLKNYDSKTIRLKNVVENNKLKKLTLQELAFLSNMSLSTFKREFNKHYQLTPIKWFQEKRLEHSAFLLGTRKKSPSELYEEAGYESLSNFIQAFKKKYGKTPKQFQVER